MILAHVPAAAHLQRVLRECMRERRRDAPRRGRIGRDRIAADAADVPEARQVDRRDSKIGRVERTRVQPQALRIDLVAGDRERLADRRVPHPRLEQRL